MHRIAGDDQPRVQKSLERPLGGKRSVSPAVIIRSIRSVHIPVFGVYRLDVCAGVCRDGHRPNLVKHVRDPVDDYSGYRTRTCTEADLRRFRAAEIQIAGRMVQTAVRGGDVRSGHFLDLLHTPRDGTERIERQPSAVDVARCGQLPPVGTPVPGAGRKPAFKRRREGCHTPISVRLIGKARCAEPPIVIGGECTAVKIPHQRTVYAVAGRQFAAAFKDG